jgi:uncharacterized protein YjbJ (UPF0337 family)
MVQQMQSRLRLFGGRVKERWGRMLDVELAKMENHRRELIGAVHSWTPEGSRMEQGIQENQPGLS